MMYIDDLVEKYNPLRGIARRIEQRRPFYAGDSSLRTFERVIVGGIICFGLALYLAVVSPSFEVAKRTRCRANLRQIYYALQMYVTDHDQSYPVSSSLMENLVTYTESKDYNVFHCPSDERSKTFEKEPPLDEFLCSYAFNPELIGTHDANVEPNMPIAWDKNGALDDKRYTNHEKGGNVLFADGSVFLVRDEKWLARNKPPMRK